MPGTKEIAPDLDPAAWGMGWRHEGRHHVFHMLRLGDVAARQITMIGIGEINPHNRSFADPRDPLALAKIRHPQHGIRAPAADGPKAEERRPATKPGARRRGGIAA